ncbi:MAG: LPS assembly protein LptD, partial [Pseudomonadota bacterium]|nr:LPS assembly protein LptD [Pseudomonadota bacterium]
MLPPVETTPRISREATRPTTLTALALALFAAQPALAQDAADAVGSVVDPRGTPGDPQPDQPTVDTARDSDELLAVPDPNAGLDAPPAPTGDDGVDAAGNRAIDFEADILEYSANSDTVTASGNVVLRSGDRSLRADSVSWNESTGEILATGRVRFVDENGNQLFSERVELTDEFEAGAMDNLLLALRQGGRLAATRGLRESDGTVALEQAAYSGCEVVDPQGCPRDPSWRITAERVVYDPASERISFNGAFLELFGARILPLPGLTIRTDGGAVSGFLVPDLRFSESNGVEVSGSYYIRFADDKDLTLTTHVYTDAAPMVAAQWRHLTESGAYQITGYATHSQRISTLTGVADSAEEFRGYLFANGKFQLTPDWSLTGSIRRSTDRTFLRRYDISRDDRLRSTIELERIAGNTYF